MQRHGKVILGNQKKTILSIYFAVDKEYSSNSYKYDAHQLL